MQILEVSDLSLHFMVAMLQSHFHHMNHFVDWDGRRVLVLEHARSLEFSLVDKGDLSHRDHNSRFLRLALESLFVLVDKEGKTIEHQVSFD